MRSLLIVQLGLGFALALEPQKFEWNQIENDDLHTFISRPDIRPPKFNIEVHDEANISPGYWFLAPYGDLHDRHPSSRWSPGQTGPHIFDSRGELIWSGSHLFGERPTFDFKVAACDGEPCMTFIVNEGMHEHTHQGGAGVILDSSFRITDVVETRNGRGTTNMHEFTVSDQNTALMISFSSQFHRAFAKENVTINGWIGNNGFLEVDIATGKTLFEWWALDHVSPEESRVKKPAMPSEYSKPWDFFHLNSVEKLPSGDYLISARYTDCIYLISHVDGSVIWRLGGSKSSFDIQDFSYARQHDARFHSANDTTVIISLFNNAADDFTAIATSSSVLLIALDLPSMKARLLQQWQRPDKTLTRLRGNAQTLPNGNMFVGWSENAVITEFNRNGDCVLEARWRSTRFSTYRAYKFNLTSSPSEIPALVVQAYGTSPAKSISVFYVSWNGAIEVASWRFYNASNGLRGDLVGTAKKNTFETVLMVDGYISEGIAEAVSGDGMVLGSSPAVMSITPDILSIHNEPSSDIDKSANANSNSNDITVAVSPPSARPYLPDTGCSSRDESFMEHFQAESFAAGAISTTLLLVFGIIFNYAWRKILQAKIGKFNHRYTLVSGESEEYVAKCELESSYDNLP